MSYLPEIIIALISGGIGAVITGYFNVKGKNVESTPNVIEVLSKRITDQEKRLDELNNRLNVQQMELEHWRNAYSKLMNWLKKVLTKHSISENIPDFHSLEERGD